jgi:hypothetical protein
MGFGYPNKYVKIIGVTVRRGNPCGNPDERGNRKGTTEAGLQKWGTILAVTLLDGATARVAPTGVRPPI